MSLPHRIDFPHASDHSGAGNVDAERPARIERISFDQLPRRAVLLPVHIDLVNAKPWLTVRVNASEVMHQAVFDLGAQLLRINRQVSGNTNFTGVKFCLQLFGQAGQRVGVDRLTQRPPILETLSIDSKGRQCRRANREFEPIFHTVNLTLEKLLKITANDAYRRSSSELADQELTISQN